MKRLYLLTLMLFTGSVFAQTDKTQVEFVATVANMNSVDSQSGTLSMQLTSTYAIVVRATSRTEIRDSSDFPLLFSDLSTGMKLKIEGMFTEEGILAREIAVTRGNHGAEVFGVLEALDLRSRTVTVAGLTIPLSDRLEIRNEDGVWLTASELETGQSVKVEGTVHDGAFEAAAIKVDTFGLGRSRLDFDGTVHSMAATGILVKIDGVGDALVRIHPETEVHGHLSEGEPVRISGRIGDDLAVDASRVVVKRRLQLNPDELHLGLSDSGRIHVFLAAPAEADTVLLVRSGNSSIAEPMADSLVIPAGGVAGYFDIVSGETEGEARIDVTLPESLGAGTFSVEVEVETENRHGGSDDSPAGGDDSQNGSSNPLDDSGQAADDSPHGPDDSGHHTSDPATPQPELLEIRFSPDQIMGAGNRSLHTQLVLNQTASADMTVRFALDEGMGQPVVFPSELTIPAGGNFVNVELMTGTLTSDVKIRAHLPASAGGDSASLKLRVRN